MTLVKDYSALKAIIYRKVQKAYGDYDLLAVLSECTEKLSEFIKNGSVEIEE
jgi:hypothetical protein